MDALDDDDEGACVGRDRPMAWCWRLDGIDFDSAPGARGDKLRQAMQIIYGGLFMADKLDPGRWSSYARRPAAYVQSRYLPEAITFATMMRAIDSASRSGMIEDERSLPRQRGWQSRMRLLEEAVAEFGKFGVRLFYDPAETIILRAKDKKLIDYKDNDRIRRMRSDLQRINETLAATELAQGLRLIRQGDVVAGAKNMLPARNALYRIFNGAFDLGGRFYGGWWQNIKKEERPEIIINWSRVIERDFDQIHPTLLYGLAGRTFDGDAYEIDGCDRSLAKRAFNTLVNAASELEALRSIARKIGGPGAFDRAWELIGRLKDRHPDIADSFGTGAGLRLMRYDSDLAEAVMLSLIDRGISSLPVHDSYIVEERHYGVLGEVMEQELDLTLKRIGGNVPTIISLSGKNVPQYGDTVSLSGRSPVPVVCPDPGNDNYERQEASSRPSGNNRLRKLESEAA
jgi:hypothetical protein